MNQSIDAQRILRTLCLGVCLLFASSAWAATAEKSLSNLLDNYTSMEGKFSQELTTQAGQALQQSKGSMALVRPGKFRWAIQTPFKQLIIADGKQLWIYDEDLEQVTVHPQTESLENTPAMLLSGSTAGLNKQFVISQLTKPGAGSWFLLKSKSSQSMIQQVEIQFIDQKLATMIITDNLGQAIRLTFTQVKLNTRLANSLFTFTPPAGVDVIKKQ